jgi:hypothetical protein
VTQPTPSPSPEPAEDTVVEDAEPVAEVEEVPLNRAARRAKAKKSIPAHVGPRAGRTDQGRGARSHTKRQIG